LHLKLQDLFMSELFGAILLNLASDSIKPRYFKYKVEQFAIKSKSPFTRYKN
jgi:hypothetical protein